MSETDNNIEVVDPEVGEIATVHHPDIESPNPIADLIDKIGEKDYTSAEKTFQDVMQDRLDDVLDQAKIRLAGQMYNYEEPEEISLADLDSEEEEDDSEENDEV